MEELPCCKSSGKTNTNPLASGALLCVCLKETHYVPLQVTTLAVSLTNHYIYLPASSLTETSITDARACNTVSSLDLTGPCSTLPSTWASTTVEPCPIADAGAMDDPIVPCMPSPPQLSTTSACPRPSLGTLATSTRVAAMAARRSFAAMRMPSCNAASTLQSSCQLRWHSQISRQACCMATPSPKAQHATHRLLLLDSFAPSRQHSSSPTLLLCALLTAGFHHLHNHLPKRTSSLLIRNFLTFEKPYQICNGHDEFVTLQGTPVATHQWTHFRSLRAEVLVQKSVLGQHICTTTSSISRKFNHVPTIPLGHRQSASTATYPRYQAPHVHRTGPNRSRTCPLGASAVRELPKHHVPLTTCKTMSVGKCTRLNYFKCVLTSPLLKPKSCQQPHKHPCCTRNPANSLINTPAAAETPLQPY